MYVWTGDEKYLNDYIDQLLAHNEKLLDKEWGFWVHGWYADSTSESWNGIAGKQQNPLQRSSEFWGRGNGWIMLSVADALSVMPKNHLKYEQVKQIYLGLMKQLPKLQDPKTGHWYQLPIYPNDPKNWIESSATAMFGYSICKGLKMGILDKKVFGPVATKAYHGLGKYSVKYISDGKATTKNVCTGTVIGNKDYYLSRKIVEGEDYALGAFIMFGTEYLTLNEI
ncbi:MAG: hypothetical protein HC905_00910 [Bacteroidales bacterium]|nr:hypothetical protein [Bacteroidales bacterium]